MTYYRAADKIMNTLFTSIKLGTAPLRTRGCPPPRRPRHVSRPLERDRNTRPPKTEKIRSVAEKRRPDETRTHIVSVIPTDQCAIQRLIRPYD